MVALVCVAVVVAIVTTGHKGAHPAAAPPAQAPPGASPQILAQTACTNMQTVQHLIATNGPAGSVLSYLSAAQSEIAGAEVADPSFMSLQSGIQSISDALHEDNPSDAQVGISIVRYQCRLVGVSLAPTPSPAA